MTLAEHLNISGRAVKLVFTLERTLALCLTAGAALSAAIPYVPIYFSAKLIDALYQGAELSILLGYVALTVGLVFVLKLLETYIGTARERAYSSMYRRERWTYSEKAMDMAYESTESAEVTVLRERIRKETQTGYNRFYLHKCMSEISSCITQIICSLSLTVSFFTLREVPLVWKLGLLGLIGVVIGVSVLTTRLSEQKVHKLYSESVFINMYYDKYMDYIMDYSSAKDIRLYGMSDSLISNMDQVMTDIDRKAWEVSRLQTVLELPNLFCNQLLKYATYLVLLVGCIAGAVSVGAIARYVSCVMLFLTAVTKLVRFLQLALVNNQYMKRYFSYFDIPNHMYQGTLTVEKRDDAEYEVEFRDVSFRYPHTESYALRHVDLKFKVGEKLALVGMNGSGKTTFIKLLCRLYDPTEGVILLNGVDIRKYDYKEYMDIFSVVFQDFAMFGFSIGQNVAASEQFEEERVRACLKKVGLGGWLEGLADGVHTHLYKSYDQSGLEISGGEAQKLALARALYKDAPFMVLDEPTAALDPVSEYEVYSKFNTIAGEKTAVYISHRLASCRFCDKIAVFHEGGIVQQGSHEELLAETGGKYQELWNAQAQYYTA